MTGHNDEIYRRRIAELEAENARLRESLDFVKAERKELRERVYGPANIETTTTEEELLEVMKKHVPGSGARLLAELGIAPGKPD